MNNFINSIFVKWRLDTKPSAIQAVRSSPYMISELGQVKTESEKSYSVSMDKSLMLESILLLHVNPSFSVAVTFANMILMIWFTYENVFLKENSIYKFHHSVLMDIIIGLCYTLIGVEKTSMILHRYFRKLASKNVVKPINMGYQFLAIIYQILTGLFYFLEFNYLIIYCFECLRTIKIICFFRQISDSPGRNTVWYILVKFAFVSTVCLHLSACNIKIIHINFIDQNNWLDPDDTIFNLHPLPFNEYIFAIYSACGGFFTLGFVSPSIENDYERAVLIYLMLIGVFFVGGIILGICTGYMIELYQTNAVHMYRLNLINDEMADPRIPPDVKRKVKTYYVQSWTKQGATYFSKLFDTLPQSIQGTVYLDKYWNAINACNLFIDTHIGFKRSVCCRMTTKVITAGEVIYEQDMAKTTLIYVDKGTIQLLSAEDKESPILTLESGTALGEISLVCSTPNYVQVIAYSHCVVHCLDKADLWYVANYYRKMSQSSIILQNYRKIIHSARDAFSNKTQRFSISLEFAIMSKEQHSEGLKGYQMPYNVMHEYKYFPHDNIFYRASFPWILQKDTTLTLIWDVIVVCTVLICTVIIPFQRSFHTHNSSSHVSAFYIESVYALDVLLQLIIVIEDEDGLHTTIFAILKARLKTVRFYLDLYCALPFHLLSQNSQSSTHIVLSFSKLLKFHKVITIIMKVENTFIFSDILVPRIFKYIIYIIFMSYLMGVIYYMNSCAALSGCYHGSWIDKLKAMLPGITKINVFINSIQIMYLITSLTGGGTVFYTTTVDVILLVMFSISGVLLCEYITADFCATLALRDTKQNVNKFLENISKLRQSPLHKSYESQRNLQLMYAYVSSQWNFNHFESLRSLLRDLPPVLYNSQQCAKYVQAFQNINLFNIWNEKICEMFAAESELVYFSPEEVFVYSNEICEAMYIIEKGYCELIYGDTMRVEKVLGPGSIIGMIEVMLGLRNLFFVRPLTSMALIKLSRRRFFCVIRLFPKLASAMDKMKPTIMRNPLFNDKIIQVSGRICSVRPTSFCRFASDKTDAIQIDYMKGWSNYRVFRHLMLPISIYPEGKFIIVWETIFIVISFIFVCTSLLQDFILFIGPFYKYLNFTLMVLYLIGMYIRLYVCYYNVDGILITHPRCTAMNYITGAFIIDFIVVLPISTIVQAFIKNNEETNVYSIYGLNRLLAIYRFPMIMDYYSRNDFTEKIRIQLLKWVPLVGVFILACGTLLSVSSVQITVVDGVYGIKTTRDSLLSILANKTYDYKDYKPTPLYTYQLLFYWILCIVLQVGHLNIPILTNEIVVSVGIKITGYLLFKFILVIIEKCQTEQNSKLTVHQGRMTQLIIFMKEQKVPIVIQQHVIEYFEYHWKRNHGQSGQYLQNMCHHVLYEDFMYHQYRDTFHLVPVFIDLNSTTYRALSLNMERFFIMHNISFIKLNDIISNIYIVHSGKIKVYGPSKKLWTILGPGCVVGNLDNVPYSRSMVTLTSSESVDLLKIESQLFYEIMPPSVRARLQNHIMGVNISFVEIQASKKGRRTIRRLVRVRNMQQVVKKSVRILKSKVLQYMYMFCSYLSILGALYSSSFLEKINLKILLLIYPFDVLHLLIIILKFTTPYVDSKGQIIISKKDIRNKFVRTYWLYINIIALIPLELPFLFFSYYGTLCFRVAVLNRCLRYYNIYKFYKDSQDILNANMLATKLSSVFVHFTLLMHMQSCILFILGNYEDSKDSWIYVTYKSELVKQCRNKYMCSMMMSTSLITLSGYNTRPRGSTDMTVFAILIMFDKFCIAIAIAKLSACIRNCSAELLKYDHRFTRLHGYLKQSLVSRPLIHNVLTYSNLLWFTSRGLQEPILLSMAPRHIQEEIKFSAFGKHILNNLLFAKCHIDFIRQLLWKMKMEVFFKGHFICQQGDINDTMYFVHSGSIDVFFETPTEEIKVDELVEMDCFGVLQGLFERTPHTHTYKASGLTLVLTLKLNDWKHMLTFFPASKFYIYEKLNTISD